MTVAELCRSPLRLGIFGLMGALPQDATVRLHCPVRSHSRLSRPFNRPVARLFLGDVGSLPIGLILSWLLVLLAGKGHLAAALLLPLYYLAVQTRRSRWRVASLGVSPLRRLIGSHFYQRATGGYGIYQIVGIVFTLNILLVALAAASIWSAAAEYQIAILAIGGALVGAVLWIFNSVKG